MHEAWTHQLETWHEFYLLIGTAGMTLTGLLFVVVSLGPRVVANHQATGVRAFISPNAVYFATTLVVSAVFLIPDLPTIAVGAFLFLGAGASLGYLAYTKVHRQWRHKQASFSGLDLVCRSAYCCVPAAFALRHWVLVASHSINARSSSGSDSAARNRHPKCMGPRYLDLAAGA